MNDLLVRTASQREQYEAWMNSACEHCGKTVRQCYATTPRSGEYGLTICTQEGLANLKNALRQYDAYRAGTA